MKSSPAKAKVKPRRSKVERTKSIESTSSDAPGITGVESVPLYALSPKGLVPAVRVKVVDDSPTRQPILLALPDLVFLCVALVKSTDSILEQAKTITSASLDQVALRLSIERTNQLTQEVGQMKARLDRLID